MEHIPEDELALFAFDPAALSEERREAIARHTTSCAGCRSRRDFFAVTEDDLMDGDVWEASAGSATYDALMAWAARIAEEDREADELLKPFLASAAKTVWADLNRQKPFLTGGVVRRLSAHAHGIYESRPLDALTFADAAISVAEALADDACPANAVYELRGTAWKERANAQMLLGDFPGALDSLAHAERAYRRLTSPSLGLATVALVRASVFCEQQRLEEAGALAQQAEHVFAHLGDDERRMSALYLRGVIRYEASDLAAASKLFEQVSEYGESISSPRWMARALIALGNCEIDRGNLGEASIYLHQALAFVREGAPANERVSAEWGIARLLVVAGKRDEGTRRLGDVAREFEGMGMMTDAALARLQIAEALLASGQRRQIVELAKRQFQVFTNAGMLTGALTAMAYVKEAAAAGTLTASDLLAVQKFLRRAERQPDLLFVPPPKNS